VSNDHFRLSLVLPAYNEAERLPPYLVAVRAYLDGTCGTGFQPVNSRQVGNLSYEVIVVDDGSTDGLEGVLRAAAADWPQLRSIRHPKNLGKGAAVRTGVLASRGQRVLFADADGATPIDQEGRLREAICGGADVAVGSRLVAGEGLSRSRNWLRAWIGRTFARLARGLLRLPVRDTQCGFKMFRGDAARALFAEVQEPGYLFDLEVLARAQRRGMKIVEVPVSWREIPGGHFRLVRAMPRILLGLWRLRRLKTPER